ncbi:hypothetical protein K3495_g4064 [Podosphaera aphanis]|nr:hypothetical protein K3495_g4064 [Podosphaera aphanis]
MQPQIISDDQQSPSTSQPIFHSFLRAFYPFTQTYAVSDTTVISLNEGDVILIHSIHTNGWADGTVLSSGARGWLPTNFCEPYEPEPMQCLLSAFLNFWDTLRLGVGNDSEFYFSYAIVQDVIAGVKYLFEKTHCSSRDSPFLCQDGMLRRYRKVLLSELASLCKNAKRLKEASVNPRPSAEEINQINDSIDEMMIRVFRIITCGIRFLDIFGDITMEDLPILSIETTSINNELKQSLPPSPIESPSSEILHQESCFREPQCRRNSSQSEESKSHTGDRDTHSDGAKTSNDNSSAIISVPQDSETPCNSDKAEIRYSQSAKNLSRHMGNEGDKLLNKLCSSHDTLLSFLGSFIGQLHLPTTTSSELVNAIRQFVTAGEELLETIGIVSEISFEIAQHLKPTRDSIEKRIQQLVDASGEITQNSGRDEKAIVSKNQKTSLLVVSTGCVKAAGECVAKTQTVIRRIFSLNTESTEFQPDVLYMTSSKHLVNKNQENTHEPNNQNIQPFVMQPSHPPPPPPVFTIPDYQKPLPLVPPLTSSVVEKSIKLPTPISPHTSRFTEVMFDTVEATSDTICSPGSNTPGIAIPPDVDSMPEICMAHDEPSRESLRASSIAISNDGTSNTSFNSMRGSESSFASQISTRATTPDHSLHLSRSRTSTMDICVADSQTSHEEEMADAEVKFVAKTFAHELIINKEGSITGGTIPALVERLTAHDSTPDSIFVSTFYLTFRLFVSPTDLAQTLIERFDYVTLSPTIAGPVQLRVYNVFKGWLETHWQEDTDHEAITIIQAFASEKLSKVLPAASRRLLELSAKVSSTSRPLVPRMVSSMGKISTSITQYTAPESTVPPPIMNKSSMSSLKNWKTGSSQPIILDFDPLEIARHLTMMGIQIFCSILPHELLDSEWTKGLGSKAPNVRAMATLSTDLSNFVADTILQFEDVKKRANIIKHWIKVAQKCSELHNYDSLMAIICSLNSSTINRLKRTWDAVSARRKEMLKNLQTVVEPDKNLANLRRRLHDHVPPCLPFVGMFLTDLTFVNAGNASTRQLPGVDAGEGLTVINFDKHTRTAKIIGELQRFQLPYRLVEVPELKEWLQSQIARVKSYTSNEQDNQLYRKSLLLEPRESQVLSRSPTDASFTTLPKDKFDIFGWATKERSNSLIPPTANCH